MPRFNNAEIESIENRLRGLEKKVDLLTKRVNAEHSEPSIDSISSISVANDTYYSQSKLLYQTPKDGIEDQKDGDDRYGHRVLSLNEDGTGSQFRVARLYYSGNYTTVESKSITWEIVDGKVVISG